jgi:deoxyribodipyrimidine photolyase-like uncharacterized protein
LIVDPVLPQFSDITAVSLHKNSPGGLVASLLSSYLIVRHLLPAIIVSVINADINPKVKAIIPSKNLTGFMRVVVGWEYCKYLVSI